MNGRSSAASPPLQSHCGPYSQLMPTEMTSLLWHFNRKKKKKCSQLPVELAEGFKHLPSHFACGPNTLTVRASGAAAEAKIVKQQIT